MSNTKHKTPEIIFDNVANLGGYWRIYGLNLLIMKSDIRLTTFGVSLNPVNRSSSSEQEGPQQYIKIVNSTIGILKTTSGITISITNCFINGSNTTFIEIENSTLNITGSIFRYVTNNYKLPALVFAWDNSKVNIQDTFIQPKYKRGIIINRTELHMKNVSFRGNQLDRLDYDGAVLFTYNSSVVTINNCSFAEFYISADTFKVWPNWIFVTLNGKLFSNRCYSRNISLQPYPVRLNLEFAKPETFQICTLYRQQTDDAFAYFEDTKITIVDCTFDNIGANTLVYVTEYSNLKIYNSNFGDFDVAILGIHSQIKVVKHNGNYEYGFLIAAEDSNVSMKDYNIYGRGGSLSFVNCNVTMKNITSTGKKNVEYGSAMWASGSKLHIENSTFRDNICTLLSSG